MALDKMRIKCVLGDEIRVFSLRKEVTEDELLRTLEQEYGRAMLVSHYEDHEKDVVTVNSSSGLQAALTEHAEFHSSGPMPTLKLFLQLRTIPEESNFPYSPYNNSNYNKPNISNLNLANINGHGSLYSSSPRNVLGGSSDGMNGMNGMNGSGGMNGINGMNGHSHVPLKRGSSKLSTPPLLDNVVDHATKSPLAIDMSFINNAALDAENTPPFRTPPRSPSNSPRNPLRTPPGSPHAGRFDSTEESANYERFPHNLRVETENNLHNHQNHQNSIPPNNSISPRHPNINLRPHYISDNNINNNISNISNININNPNPTTPRSTDTPPFRTPPQSPRNSRDDTPPITPSSLPPIPWIPLADNPNRSPAPAVRKLAPPQHQHAHLPILDTPSFPVPQSPQNLPIPIPFPMPKSPRVTKLPDSVIEQSKQDEEKGPIKWEKGPVIGRGGFGCVYMGMRDNGELIAVKQLEFDDTEDPKSKATVLSFAQEINVMKNLRHDNIVRYLGIQLEDKYLNIFLEYVAGGSISTLLGKFMKFAEPVIRIYTKQILQGIAYLHEHHIMHRDIKGANILVDVNGTVKLADFGCSKIFEVKSQLKTVLGTPYWMAPEVIKQSGYGRSADIWSLGCVIIEMATGQPPWQAQFQEVTAAMFHIASSEHPPEFPANLSPEAHDFLSLCFRRNPQERPHAKKLMKHAFLQDVGKDVSLVRRNSFTAPPATPSPISPAAQWKDKPHFNRAPSTSTPPFPISPFSLTESKYKLELLPSKLLLLILKFLPLDSQAKMRYSCKQIAALVKEELWKSLNVSLKRSRSTTGGSNTSAENRKVWSDDKIAITVLRAHTRSVHCLALAESYLVSGSEDKKVRLWDVRRGKAMISLKGHTSTVTGVCVDRSSHVYSASADGTVRIWSPYKNGALAKRSSVNMLSGPTLPLTSIALAESETKVVAGSFDKSICVWEVGGKSNLLHTLTGHEGAVHSVRCDGNIIVSASDDSMLKVWDLRTPSHAVKTLNGHVGEVKSCFMHNNQVVSGGADKLVRTWDIGTGRVIKQFDHGYAITGVTCDASKIVSSGDKMVKLWEWDSDVCARTLGLSALVHCVLCDDLRVFAGGQDKVVRVLSPDTLTATPKPFFFARLRGLEL